MIMEKGAHDPHVREGRVRDVQVSAMYETEPYRLGAVVGYKHDLVCPEWGVHTSPPLPIAPLMHSSHRSWRSQRVSLIYWGVF